MTFPPNFVDNVEYDGDPGFGEKRQGPVPKRTHESNLTGLGFDVRYPDFQVLTGKERAADQRKYTIYTTPWISAALTAGPIFGDGRFLDRSVANMNRDPKFQYEKLPQPQFGLDVYTPTTVDVSKRFMNPETRTFGSDIRDRDIFVHRGITGKWKHSSDVATVNIMLLPASSSSMLDCLSRLKSLQVIEEGSLNIGEKFNHPSLL